MKSADEISRQLEPHVMANNGAIGETNRRLVKIGDGQGNPQPATLLTPRDVFYRSDLDQNDRGVAILHPKCPIPIEAIDGYYDMEVWLANVPGSSEPYIVDIADTGLRSTGGVTPSEGLARDAAFPSQDRMLILRCRPSDTAGLSIFVDVGIYAIAYVIPTGGYGFFSSATIDLSDPTNDVVFIPATTALSSGEHRIVGVALDPTTGGLIAIPGTAVAASDTPPQRGDFGENDYTAIDFTDTIPCGYIYTYFGQTEFVEDDCLRIYDPRLIADAMTTGGGGTGDVVGPASATNNDLAAFDGTTGKLIKDSGLTTANAGKAIAALADKFLLQTADATNLPNAQAMGALATGIVKNTATTGVQSIAAAGTDYTSPTGTENLSNKTITASSLIATALSLLIGGFKAIFSHANTADRTYTLRDETGTLQMQRLTTKGDLLTYDTSDVRLGIGSNNQALIADSSQTKGVKWALVSLVNSITGILGLANGGTNADLSAGGGAHNVLRQNASHVVSSGALFPADINNGFTIVQAVADSTFNVASPPSTVDGVTVSSGKLILVADNLGTGTSNVNNGVWIYNGAATPLTRSAAVYATGSIQQTGFTVYVLDGTSYKGTFWYTLQGDVTGFTVDTDATRYTAVPELTAAALKMTTSPGAGKFLKSDANGLGSWSTVPNLVGDSGAGGTAGLAPAPATGDAIRGLFGDATYVGAARKLVALTVLGGDAANIDLTSIPTTYSSLLLRLWLRSDRAATSDNAYLRFNNDSTAANYYSYTVAANGGTVAFTSVQRLAATGTGFEINLGAVGNTGPANEFSTLDIEIFNYASTAQNRVVRMNGYSRLSTTGGTLNALFGGGSWLNTSAAISRITILPVTGTNWKAGSAYMLYGLSS